MATASVSGSLMLQEKQYMDFCVRTDQVTLRRPEHGKNVKLTVNGSGFEIGRIASAFPLSDALETVAFFDIDGEEIGVMRHINSLDPESLGVLNEELEKAYFMPRIGCIVEIVEHLGVESWTVITDRGERTFEVRDPRRNIRKMAGGRVIIKDVDGNRYEIPDWYQLDRKSVDYMMQHL